MAPKPLRVLLVDDRPEITRSIRRTLAALSWFRVREVNDARQARSAAVEFQPDVVLLDLDMPYLDGGDVASELHADPRTRNATVVFLSTLLTKDEAGRHARDGKDLTLAKPFRLLELLALLREAGVLERTDVQPGLAPAGAAASSPASSRRSP